MIRKISLTMGTLKIVSLIGKTILLLKVRKIKIKSINKVWLLIIIKLSLLILILWGLIKSISIPNTLILNSIIKKNTAHTKRPSMLWLVLKMYLPIKSNEITPSPKMIRIYITAMIQAKLHATVKTMFSIYNLIDFIIDNEQYRFFLWEKKFQ